MSTSIAAALELERIGFKELSEKYGPLQSMIKELLGTLPNCSQYLEIWPPAFRTYSLLVANFLNLPTLLFGFSAPKDIVGLVMYATACINKCNYCVAHSCSFALRRGASVGVITRKESSDSTDAAIAVAEALSSTPHKYDKKLRHSLENKFGVDNADWLAIASALMSFLNKAMGSIQVELEDDLLSEVSTILLPTGWRPGKAVESAIDLPAADSMGTYLRVLFNAPGILHLQSKWVSGMPTDAESARLHVDRNYHWDEPVLSKMRHAQPRLAVSVALQENLCKKQSTLDIRCKALAGIAFAVHMDSGNLQRRCEKLGEAVGLEASFMRAVADGEDYGLDPLQAIVVRLARSLSCSPPAFGDETIREATSILTKTQLVEIVVWLALLQLIYRLSVWYEIE